MARRHKSTVTLPPPGSTYLVPLDGGEVPSSPLWRNDETRFGVARVLRAVTEEERSSFGDCVLVATSSWIGTEAPHLDDPSLRQILRLTHHGWRDEPQVVFVGSPPPPQYRLLGAIEPSAEDLATECHSVGGWMCALQRTLQWRWDHDRESLLAEEAQQAIAAKAATERAAALAAHRRATLTWAALRAKPRFESWAEVVDPAIVAASRELFTTAIDALASAADKRQKRALLKQLVVGFNRLDQAHGRFIMTIEREDICDELEELIFLAGFPNEPHLADKWRDW